MELNESDRQNNLRLNESYVLVGSSIAVEIDTEEHFFVCVNQFGKSKQLQDLSFSNSVGQVADCLSGASQKNL